MKRKHNIIIMLFIFFIHVQVRAQQIEIECNVDSNVLTKRSYDILDSIVEICKKNSIKSVRQATWFSADYKNEIELYEKKRKLDMAIVNYLESKSISVLFLYDYYYFSDQYPFIEIEKLKSDNSIPPPPFPILK